MDNIANQLAEAIAGQKSWEGQVDQIQKLLDAWKQEIINAVKEEYEQGFWPERN